MTSRDHIARLIADDHQRLKGMIVAISVELVEEPTVPFENWNLMLLRRLRDLQGQLRKHFDLEEHGGFMDEIISHAPHFLPRVQSLADEHEEVLVALETILSELKLLGSPDEWRNSTVQARLLALFDLLREHEEAENSLLQETYFQDLGVGG